MSNWWQIKPGYPIMSTNERDGNDNEIWQCGVCHSLMVRPTKHIAWHEMISQPKAVTVVLDGKSIMDLANQVAKEEQ